MRTALNENPMVQMAVLGITAVVLAFIMFTTVLKKEDPAETPPVTTEAGVPAADGTVTPATDAGTVAPPAATGTVTPPPADTGTVAPPATGTGDGLLPSKGLPEDLLVAYAKGDAIVLLVTDPKAKGSKRLADNVRASARGDVAVFVVDVDDIAKYSRITEGVSVSRAPALVVIRPRKLSEGGPMATVTYDITDERTVTQAIDDAFYEGGNVPAYPLEDPSGNKGKKGKGKGKD